MTNLRGRGGEQWQQSYSRIPPDKPYIATHQTVLLIENISRPDTRWQCCWGKSQTTGSNIRESKNHSQRSFRRGSSCRGYKRCIERRFVGQGRGNRCRGDRVVRFQWRIREDSSSPFYRLPIDHLGERDESKSEGGR